MLWICNFTNNSKGNFKLKLKSYVNCVYKKLTKGPSKNVEEQKQSMSSYLPKVLI